MMEKTKQSKRLSGHSLLLMITVILFIAMYVAGCIMYANKGFTHLQNFLNILISNAGLICVASGMTCVMLTGGIDISVGSLIAMDCMILADGMANKGWNAVFAIVLVLIIGVVWGVVQGFLVGFVKIQPFIVTMAGMFFGRGMTAVINTEQVSITKDVSATFYNMANAKINLPQSWGYMAKTHKIAPYIRPSVLIALAVVVVIWFILKYTKFGRVLYAVGGNETSASMMGLNVKKTKMKAYILSSVLCSIGGILYCLNTQKGYVQQAKGLEMDAIAAAVIGGTLLTGGVGNVWGTLIGVLITGTITSLVMTNGKLLSSWSNILTAALLCLFILLQAVFAYIQRRSES